jgi:predicted TIM-barrel enzyme
MAMPRAADLQPRADLTGLRAEDRARSVFIPALASFPPATWTLAAHLPVLDVNGALAQALDGARGWRDAPPVAGIFACDPFLRLPDLAALLGRAGIREVVNYPTVQVFEGETAAALASVGYRAEAEFRLLLRLAERGFAPIACATSREAADAALGLGLRRVLLHPGVTPPADPSGWWADLAGHVAIEGGEALAWREPGPTPQGSRPRRRIRL